jgi:probable HAF family extracellular repeat protein
MQNHLGELILGVAIASGIPTLAQAEHYYQVIDLGVLPGGNASTATSISGSGLIAGTSDVTTASNPSSSTFADAATFSTSSPPTDLGYLPSIPNGSPFMGLSSGTGINNSGQVVGSSFIQDSTGSMHPSAFLYQNGSMTTLKGLNPNLPSAAFGINNSGQITGYAYDPVANADRAFLYTNGSVANLPFPNGFTSTFGHAVNDLGDVVGGGLINGESTGAGFIYSNGKIQVLGGLSDALAINNLDEVVGSTDLSGNGDTQHAFSEFNGSYTDLGILTTNGIGSSVAYGLNDLGQIVGFSQTDIGQSAFLYQQSMMVDLNTLIDPSSGWTLTAANAINDQGQIVGVGQFNGVTRAFLLEPPVVPEPSSILMLGSGILITAAVTQIISRKSFRKGRT